MPVLEMNPVTFSLATDLDIESCPLRVEDIRHRGYLVRHGTVWATSMEKQSVTLDEGFSKQSQTQFPKGHVKGSSSWDVAVVGQAQWGGNKSSNYRVEQVFCCCFHPTTKRSKEARLRMKFPLKCLYIPPQYLKQWERCLPLNTGSHKTRQEKQWLPLETQTG